MSSIVGSVHSIESVQYSNGGVAYTTGDDTDST